MNKGPDARSIKQYVDKRELEKVSSEIIFGRNYYDVLK